MTSFLPLPPSTYPSTPIPSSPSSFSNSTIKQLDPEALANLIKQLKRSPESPSRLTLPPIMGIINEQDEEDQQENDDEEEDVSVIIEQVKISPNSNIGLFDIPEEDETEIFIEDHTHTQSDEQVNGLLLPVRKLWVIDEESESSIVEESQDNASFDDEELYGDENVPPIHNASEDPVDRFSPPPPSPCMNTILSPTLPDHENISIPTSPSSTHLDLDLEQYEEDDDIDNTSQETFESPSITFNGSTSTEQFSDPSIPEEQSILPIMIVPQQRRRRRTLGELEQYRKIAMTKAAWKCLQEAEAFEERRRMREQEEREGIWMRYRGNSSRSRSRERSNRPDSILRAQSFPPAARPSDIYSSDTGYTRRHSESEIVDRGDHFSSNWYEDEDEEHEVQIQHVEYVSSPQSTLIDIPATEPNYGQDDDQDDEEMLSPLSDQIATPEQHQSRRFFPSASEIFGSAPMSRYPSNDSSSSSNESWDQPTPETSSSSPSSSSFGYGLGLGLSGMNSTSHSNRNGQTRMTFDQMIKFEEGKEQLEDDEISLVELPIQAIFPDRTYEEFKAVGRDYTRRYREDKERSRLLLEEEDVQKETQYTYEDDTSVDSLKDRSSYREDLDGFPIPQRGRSRSRMGHNSEHASRYTDSYNSHGFNPVDSAYEHDHHSPSYSEYKDVYSAKSNPDTTDGVEAKSTSSKSEYSNNDSWERVTSPVNMLGDEDMYDEEDQDKTQLEHRRRHSALGKLLSYYSTYSSSGDDSEEEETQDQSSMSDGLNGRSRSKSAPSFINCNQTTESG